MNYLQVNIGRNVGDSPMPAPIWSQFVQEVADTLQDATGARPEIHHGTGRYGAVTEDSAHISVLSSYAADTHAIRAKLRKIADEYHQDTVALIQGSDLI